MQVGLHFEHLSPSAPMIVPSVRPYSSGIIVLVTVHLLLTATVPVAGQAEGTTIAWTQALEQPPGWYGSPESIRIADNVLLYQHENGGWPKNVEMAQVLTDGDRARIREALRTEGSELAGTTFDNGATYTQLRYLARVYEATRDQRFREGFLRGLDFILDAQYDNGGWPQYYPIREGYYEHVTFNDGLMIGVMRLLRDVGHGLAPFDFVDSARRSRAASAVAKGLEVILATQIEVDGRPTAWCAQYDRVALHCAQARSYELPSISGGESVEIVRYLMEIENPGPEVVAAVEAAVAWLEQVQLTGIAVVRKEAPELPRGYDRVVVADPDAPPLWARFYEIGTNRPMFVGRDGIVRDSLSQIEHERRVGYSYLGGWARDLLEREYPSWRSAVAGEAAPH